MTFGDIPAGEVFFWMPMSSSITSSAKSAIRPLQFTKSPW